MSKIDYQALRENAESTIGILENIAGFEPSNIDGDTVELRFETDGGFDTGCDVSIVDQCQKTADVVRALLDERERNQQYIKSRDQENEDIALTVGRLRVKLEAAEKRISELEAREVVLPRSMGSRDMSEFTKERIIEELKASTQNASGMFEISEDTICALMSILDAPPQLPRPSVPDEMPEPDTARMFFTDAVVAIAKVQGLNACRAAMLHGSEPETDNTNKQFESLSRGDK